MPDPNDYDLLPFLRDREARIRGRYRKRQGDCWIWRGARTTNGYGTYSIRVDGQSRSVRAHRAAFMLALDRPIAEGMDLHHMCGDPACVNPDHLLELTSAENNFHLRKGLTRWHVMNARG